MRPGGFFPTNPDLADILGRTDFDFEKILVFWIFWNPYFLISRFPDLKIPRFPDSLTRDPLKGSLEGSYTTS